MDKESPDVTIMEEEEEKANSILKPQVNRVSLSSQVNTSTTIPAPTPLSPLTTNFATASTSLNATATPVSPTSTTSTTTPFSPASATSPASTSCAQSPTSPKSPPPPLKPVRSPLRPMSRSISNGATTALNLSPKAFPTNQAGTPSTPPASIPTSARGSSSSRTSSASIFPHSNSTPNVSTPSHRPSRPRRPATPPPIDVSQIDDFTLAASLIDEIEASINPENRHLPPSLVRRNTDGSYLLGPDVTIVVDEMADKRKQRRLGQQLDGTQFLNHRPIVDELNESPISLQFDEDEDYPEIEDEDDLTAELVRQQRSIEPALMPSFSRHISATANMSTASNISHGSKGSPDIKKRDGPLPPTPSTSLSTMATVATAGNVTTPNRPKRVSISSTSPSTTPSITPSTSTTNTGTSAYSTPSASASGPLMTKRQHALHELLSSERVYASDLALVKEVHIPLALGHSIPLANSNASVSTSTGIPPTPPLLPSSVSSGSSSGSSSSGNSTRTVSVVSSTSSGSESLLSIGSAAQQLPMTPDDVRVIFSNLEEVAMFSDQFCDLLEQALGSVISLSESGEQQDGLREDCVGQLFLEIIPEMEKYYKYYIHKHPTALAHLYALTSGSPPSATSPTPASSTILPSPNPPSTSAGTGPSPALLAYLQTTSAIASQHSHAWDLPSLLIKPVQRFLKYPLLLQAILDETEDGHGDKERLKLAKGRMEECARGVNESRRRAEVVREVLMGKGTAVAGVKGVALSAGVNLGKMKSLRVGGSKRTLGGATAKDGPPAAPTLLPASASLADSADSDVAGNEEARWVEKMKEELKRIEAFSQTFARNVVDWAKMMGNMIRALRVWSVAFGRVIGLTVTPFNPAGTTGSSGSGSSVFNDAASSINGGGSQGDGQSSEAFDAFLGVIEGHLTPLCSKLETEVNDKVLKDIARLLATMNQPLKLIASMDSQAPFHQHLLTMTIGPKSRPSPALLAASQNYLALRGQLAAELPTYIKLLHKGLGVSIMKLAEVQGDFWREVKARWSDLWDMLRVEGEMNAGHEETVRVWAGRWADVDVVLATLGVCQPPAPPSNLSSKRNTQEPPPRKHSNASSNAGVGLGLSGAHVGSQSFVSPTGIGLSPSFASLVPNYEAPSYAQAYAQIVMATQAVNAPYSPPASAPVSSSPPTQTAANIMGLLGSLDPGHAPSSIGISGPLPLRPGSGKGSRPRGTSDASGKRPSTSNSFTGSSGASSIFSGKGGAGSIKRKTSMESLRSTVASVHTIKAVPSSAKRSDSHTRKQSGERGFFEFMSSVGVQQQTQPEMPRTKSMPLSTERSTSHQSSIGSQEMLLEAHYNQQPYQYQQADVEERERGRNTLRKPNPKPKITESIRSGPSSQPQSSRQRSTSKGNQTYFQEDPDAPPLPPQFPRRSAQQQQQYYARPDSWAGKKGKYICRVIHACKPPSAVSYYSYPFFTLLEGDLYEVLQEVGHPSMHPKLPLYVDDGEDCLLLCRDGYRNVGWALASFLEPIELEGF